MAAGRGAAGWRIPPPGADGELTGAAAIRFAQDLLPMLEASDEVIVEAAEAPGTGRSRTSHWSPSGRAGDDPDWFDLAIRVSVEGREVPFAPLFAALARGEECLVLDDGRYLRTDLAVLDRLREAIEEARRLEDEPGPLRLNRYAASLWGDFEEARRRGRAGGSLAGVRRCAGRARPGGRRSGARGGAGDGDGRYTAVPEGGVRLAGLPAPPRSWRHLADDMGLGKTLEVLTLLEHVRSAQPDERGAPFLVVAPASVIGNWGPGEHGGSPRCQHAGPARCPDRADGRRWTSS